MHLFKGDIINRPKEISQNVATTQYKCAIQRASNLASLNVKSVLELCVGPSFENLEKAYNYLGISLTGNDIDPRWRQHYPDGNWIICDALEAVDNNHDCTVFAPPLSEHSTGKREDSLMIKQVEPSYKEFLSKVDIDNIAVLVLPGRSLSTKRDRKQFYKLYSYIYQIGYKLIFLDHITDEGITKYIDLYIRGSRDENW